MPEHRKVQAQPLHDSATRGKPPQGDLLAPVAPPDDLLAQLQAARAKHRARPMDPSGIPSPQPDPSGIPSLAESLARIEAERQRYNRRFKGRKHGRTPKGNGPPSGYRAVNARPPPHIAVHRNFQLDDYRDAQLKAARARGFTRAEDCGGLPWWAWVIAGRVHRDWRAELLYLPRALQPAIRRAASSFTTPDAQASCAALGIVLNWLSIRHPRHCGEPSNVGGIPGALLALLTEREWRGTVGPYSLSSVQHRSHTTGAVGELDARTVGFVEALRQAGALQAWVPPAQHVPDWMRGEVYAFHIFRAVWPFAELAGPEPPD